MLVLSDVSQLKIQKNWLKKKKGKNRGRSNQK